MGGSLTIPELDRAGLRQFGLLMGGFVALVFGLLLPWLFERTLPLWPWPHCCGVWCVEPGGAEQPAAGLQSMDALRRGHGAHYHAVADDRCVSRSNCARCDDYAADWARSVDAQHRQVCGQLSGDKC